MKVKTIDLELAIMSSFDYRHNLIVHNISNMMGLVAFETDILVLNKNNYAHGFEIKVSKADLKADFKKPQHTELEVMRNGKFGYNRFFGKFKYFSYVVPESLKEIALELIPAFCGLYIYKNITNPKHSWLDCERQPKILFNYKWTDEERYEVARLGTMRIFNLKQKIRTLLK